MKNANFKYSIKNFVSGDEISLACENSTPKRVLNLFLEHKNFNYNALSFDLEIKNEQELICTIPFNNFLLKEFPLFLKEAETASIPLVFYIFEKGVETIIYFSKINKDEARFLILNTKALQQKEKEGKILSHSYVEAKVMLDILMNKNDLIMEFKKEIQNIYKKYNNIAFFEKI